MPITEDAGYSLVWLGCICVVRDVIGTRSRCRRCGSRRVGRGVRSGRVVGGLEGRSPGIGSHAEVLELKRWRQKEQGALFVLRMVGQCFVPVLGAMSVPGERSDVSCHVVMKCRERRASICP